MNLYVAITRKGLMLLPFLVVVIMVKGFGQNLQRDTILVKPGIRFVANIDSRNSFIEHHRLNIKGFNAGISFGKKRNRVTAGYYWLGYNSSQRLIDLHKGNVHKFNFASYAKTDVRFIDFAYWHTLIRTRKWVLSVPFEMGIGATKTNIFKTSNDSLLTPSNHYFCPVQVGIYGEYKALRWVGVNAQVGYRNAISPSPFRHRFAGIYYISIYPYPIWKDLKKLTARRE
jgi:hypothetical protein